MTDDITPPEDEGLEEAASAEAEEAAAAAEEALEEEVFFEGDEEGMEAVDMAAILAEAQHDALRARAAWSLVHKELFILLFANCLFFAGALAAWSRAYGWMTTPEAPLTGLDTIRGALIFALAIYGFWTMVFNIWHRQLVVWPFLLNALLALWVGIPGFTSRIGSQAWDDAIHYVDKVMPSKTMLDWILTPLSTIPPGHWLLTLGGAIVLIVLLKGVLGGHSKSRSTTAEESGGRRRRR
ncbi:MAG: hypothetical protein ACYTG6_12020 [Planctomycetota bacterium]|jgi:hypothetical protein